MFVSFRLPCFAALFFLLAFCTGVQAHDKTYRGFIIGFTGLNEAFDDVAFHAFARDRSLIPIRLSWQQQSTALTIIRGSKGYYELYGFSKGAETAMSVVQKKVGRLPGCVTTVGAYRTTNVDFRPYKIPFINYFDASGRGNSGPGIFIDNVNHSSIQLHINRFDYECKQ